MGISIWQLLIVLLIIVLLFGSKKLRSLGGDLGSALRGFKKEMNQDKEKGDTTASLDEKDADFKAPDDAAKHKQPDSEKRD